MMRRLFMLIVAVVAFSLPQMARADCVNPAGIEGEQIYNADHKVMQFCDGAQWWAMKNGTGFPSCAEGDTIVLTSTGWDCSSYAGGGCMAPSLCPNIGDVCDDSDGGTINDPIFAGFMLYQDPNSADAGKCKALYVTNNNQSSGSQWKSAIGTDDINPESIEDGKVNHANRGGGTFPAFGLCETLTDGGFDDWYFPARDELHLVWKNKSVIDVSAAGSFLVDYYWTSTEEDASVNWAWYQRFDDEAATDDGWQGAGSGNKTNSNSVRCVRRD